MADDLEHRSISVRYSKYLRELANRQCYKLVIGLAPVGLVGEHAILGKSAIAEGNEVRVVSDNCQERFLAQENRLGERGGCLDSTLFGVSAYYFSSDGSTKW